MCYKIKLKIHREQKNKIYRRIILKKWLQIGTQIGVKIKPQKGPQIKPKFQVGKMGLKMS